MNAVSREEIEQVEKELDAVLEMVQRPVTVKNADNEGRKQHLCRKIYRKARRKNHRKIYRKDHRKVSQCK